MGDLLKSALYPAAQLSPKCASHNILRSTTKSERMWLTDSAQRVGQAPRAAAFQRPNSVPTIDSLFRAQMEREQQPPKTAVLPEVAKGTQSDPHFVDA